MKRILLVLLLTITIVPNLYAAEVKNDIVSQEGNRLVVTYDLEGTEQEAKVSVTIKVGAKTYGADQLHLEGDIGTVRPGKGKRVWWNVLQDFPRGLNKDVEVIVSAGGGEFRDSVTGMQFVWVPGGCYQMGDTFGYGYPNEKPVHEVCLDGFWMGKTEVTQGQWQKVMGNNPSYFEKGDNYPVEQVSWNDAQDFIRRLNRQSGKNYRLPTEAEWEYAARSGGKAEQYAGSNSIDAVAWYRGNSGGGTHPVAQKRANGLGLYDMSGNVWEWCQDRYGRDYYSNSSRKNPQGPSSGSDRVERGGGWLTYAKSCRSANRYGAEPDRRRYNRGLRLVLLAGQ